MMMLESDRKRVRHCRTLAMLVVLAGLVMVMEGCFSALCPSVPTPDPVPGLPDLIIDGIDYSPASPGVGDPVAFTVRVKNQGASDAAAFHVQLARAGYAANWLVPSLAAGATTALPTTIPTSTSPETFTATADNLDEVVELSETNNAAQVTVAAGGLPMQLPDLVVTYIQASARGALVGDTILVVVLVKNQGTRPAGPFRVVLAGAAGPVGFDVVSTAAGETVSLGMHIVLSRSPETFTATADALEQVEEVSESNNTAQLAVTAGGYYHLEEAESFFCLEQGAVDYCSRLDWGYSNQWLPNGATSSVRLDTARAGGTLDPIGAVDFDQIEIRLRAWGCGSEAWSQLVIDYVALVDSVTGQVLGADDMEGNAEARWVKWEHSGGGSLAPVVSPVDGSQALRIHVPTGVNMNCAGVWAVRVFDMPRTMSTSEVTLRLYALAQGLGQYHHEFFEIYLYKSP